MKRFLAFVLALVMIFSMLPTLGTVAKAETTATTEQVTAKPFYGLTWHSVDRSLFDNLGYAPIITVKKTNGVLKLGYTASQYAQSIKTKLDALPEGMRYIRIYDRSSNKNITLNLDTECVIFADNSVAQLKALVTAFIEAYYAIGGKLDGIILDTEHIYMRGYYLYKDTYGGSYSDDTLPEGYNRNIYNDIVAHPRYQTEIRPKLVEMGFTFYENVGGYKSEIWSMIPNDNFSGTEKTKYASCTAIWDRFMYNRIAEYMTEAVYEPMAARYPDAVVSDYQSTDSATWENYMSTAGAVYTTSGNSHKTGNASNYNMYNDFR